MLLKSRIPKRWQEALGLRSAGVVYAFMLILAVLSVGTAVTGRPAYLSPGNVANLLDQAVFVGILAIFMTVVLLSGNFDLSVASVAAFSGAVLLSLVDSIGFLVAFAAALAVGATVGLINGLTVQLIGINAFIVTLGTMTAVRGLVLITTDARTITANDPASREAFRVFQGGRIDTPNLWWVAAAAAVIVGVVLILRKADKRLVMLAFAAAVLTTVVGMVAEVSLPLTKPTYYMFVLLLVVWAVLRFTVVGRRLYATGGNTESARLVGIRVARYKVVPFVLTGLAAGFVGSLYVSRLGAINPNAMMSMELTVIAAAILGGTALFGGSGSVVKSVIGALILFTLANGFNILNLGAMYQGVIEGLVLVIAAAIYTVAARREANKPPEADPVIADDEGEETSAPTATVTR